MELQTFLNYLITSAPLNEIQLRYRKVLNKTNSIVVIQERQSKNQPDEDEDTPAIEEIPPDIPARPTSQTKLPQEINCPPYLKRFIVNKHEVPLGHNLEVELRNTCVKILLLKAIKDIPIYAKILRDLCIENPGRKRKEPPIIQVVGKFSEFISEMSFKYNDLGNLVVTIEINGISLPNTLIDIGATINIMPVGTMQTMQLNHLRTT
jgi:hypothetical protein